MAEFAAADQPQQQQGEMTGSVTWSDFGSLEPTVIETLCMSCMKNGETRLLLTSIPFFKEVIIASFCCPHCGYSNREAQPGAALGEFGVKSVLTVTKPEDLNRQIIKSDSCSVFIPEIELEIPPKTQKGLCSTLEGILTGAVDGLSLGQKERTKETPEVALKLQQVINKLKSYAEGRDFPFTFVIDDPSGNSFIQFDGVTPSQDTSIKTTHYSRTTEQMHSMGFYEENAEARTDQADDTSSTANPTAPPSRSVCAAAGGVELSSRHLPNQLKATGWDFSTSIEDNVARIKQQDQLETSTGESSSEGIVFNVTCPSCGRQGTNEMCEIDVPGFRRCLIMAFNCINCGSRSNEVKAMGAYGERARKWTLAVETREDLNRDILKSDTASVMIPELDFEMCMGTLGGVFTTVEGLVTKVVDHLEGTADMFTGDAADLEQKKLFRIMLERLKAFVGEPPALPFTLILDDAADLSMISDRYPEHRVFNSLLKDCKKPKEPEEDTNLKVELYERTPEQNDDLGITDMKVENYEED